MPAGDPGAAGFVATRVLQPHALTRAGRLRYLARHTHLLEKQT